MEYKDFKDALKKHGLSLKDFSKISGVKYDTAAKWGKPTKEGWDRPVSDWVESWLEHYIKSKRFDDARKILCDENKNID